MSDRGILNKAVSTATMAGLLVGPAICLVQLFSDRVHWPEAFGGAVLGTVFFASTAVLGILRKDATALKSDITLLYLFKISLLAFVFLAVPADSIDQLTAAVAVVGSSVAYLLVLTLMVSRRRSKA